MKEAERQSGERCPECDGERVIMTAPAGAGHADDLAEYDPCPTCKGTGESTGSRRWGLSKCETCGTERVYRSSLNGGVTVVCPKCHGGLADYLERSKKIREERAR